jgi:hypothetical protein
MDIIGQSQSNLSVPARWKKNYNLLLIARDYLLHQQKSLMQSAQEDQRAFGLHLANAATDNFDRDFALSRASSERGTQ